MSENRSEFANILETYLSESENFGLHNRQIQSKQSLHTAQILFISSEFKKLAPRVGSAGRIYSPHASRSQKAATLDFPHLSNTQQKAWKNLVGHSADLGLRFELRELQGAWRKLLFRIHPDTNPGTNARADFSRLAADYRLLKAAFKSDQQAA